MAKVGELYKSRSVKLYDDLGNSFFWQSKAGELKRSADILWETVISDFEKIKNTPNQNIRDSIQPSVMNTFMMIAGFSIENLFKGLILFDNPEYIKDGKLRGEIIQSHDLVILKDKARIQLNSEQNEFCAIASEAVVGFGRYPIPKNASQLNSKITISGEIKKVYDDLYSICDNEYKPRFENRKR